MTLLRDVPFSAIYWSLGFLQLPAGNDLGVVVWRLASLGPEVCLRVCEEKNARTRDDFQRRLENFAAWICMWW